MDPPSSNEKRVEQKTGRHLYLYGSGARAVVVVSPFSAVIQQPWNKSCCLFFRLACIGSFVCSFCPSYSERCIHQTICALWVYFVSFGQLANADIGSIHFPDLRYNLRASCCREKTSAIQQNNKRSVVGLFYCLEGC